MVDPDISNFDLYIQDKEFTVDTDQWELNGVEGFTGTDCSGTMSGLCATVVQNSDVCDPGQCFGSCGAGDTCELTIVLQLWQPVDMQTDNPEINTVADQPVVSVSIDSIAYEITENTLNVETPAFTVYAAPSTIMSTGDPEALAIGTIAPVPPATLIPTTDIEITPNGQEALETRMGDYMTPFNIIVGSQIVVGAGDPVPQGRLSAVVRVRAHAGL